MSKLTDAFLRLWIFWFKGHVVKNHLDYQDSFNTKYTNNPNPIGREISQMKDCLEQIKEFNIWINPQ